MKQIVFSGPPTAGRIIVGKVASEPENAVYLS